MIEPKSVSRREFVSAVASVAAVSFLPAHGVLAAVAARRNGAAGTAVAAAAAQAQVKSGRILGQAPRDQREQEHTVDGKTVAHQRAPR
jgi:hypothetical protein